MLFRGSLLSLGVAVSVCLFFFSFFVLIIEVLTKLVKKTILFNNQLILLLGV